MLLVGPQSSGYYVCYDMFPCEIDLSFFGASQLRGFWWVVAVDPGIGCGKPLSVLNETNRLPARQGRLNFKWPHLKFALREDPEVVQLCWGRDLDSATIEAGGIEVWPGNKNPEANFVQPAFFDPATTLFSFGFIAMLGAGVVCGLKPARQFDADGDRVYDPVLRDKHPPPPTWMTAQLLAHLRGRRSVIRYAQERDKPELEFPTEKDVPTYKPFEALDELSLHEKVTTRAVPSRGDADPMYLTERSLSSRVKFFDGKEKTTVKRVSIISPSHRDAQRAADAMYMERPAPPRPPLHSPGMPGSVGSVGFSIEGDSFGDTQGSFRDTRESFRVSRTTTF